MSGKTWEQLFGIDLYEDPEMVFKAWPLYKWIDKQVVPPDTVNVYTSMSEMWDHLVELSPTLSAIRDDEKARSDKRRSEAFNKPGGLADMIRKHGELAEYYRCVADMLCPTAHGW